MQVKKINLKKLHLTLEVIQLKLLIDIYLLLCYNMSQQKKKKNYGRKKNK